MHACPTCGASCNCNGGDDLEEPAPDDCACPCSLDACSDCPHSAVCDVDGCPGCLLDAQAGCDDAPPYVCPGCHAVGGERCAGWCPDAAIDDAANDAACPSCGGHGAHFATCPDLHFEDGDDDRSA